MVPIAPRIGTGSARVSAGRAAARTNRLTLAAFAMFGFAATFAAAISPSEARQERAPRNISRIENAPLLAIVGLKEQRVTIYDASGKIMQSPVSSGAEGLDTPAGIYSVVQKEVDHTSNVYDDAEMPFMERITWTGIALHAGALPGYPASHGCVRMPLEFAEQLYQKTKVGMRVVVAREDIAPAEIAAPVFFRPGVAMSRRTSVTPRMDRASADGKTEATAVANPSSDNELPLDLASRMTQLQSLASARLRERDDLIRQDAQLRQTAARKAAEATPAVRNLRAAEASLAKAEADLKAAEQALATASTAARGEQAEIARETARARIEAAKAQLETAQSNAQAKAEASQHAEEEAKAAALAMSSAVEAAEDAKQNLSPVSVFISRKTQRLYIRKANMPVFESPVLIRDAGKPIGSFVFTALDFNGGAGGLRWNVVSLYANATNIAPFTPAGRNKSRSAEPLVSDVAGAEAALDRLDVPREAAERISEVVLPGSSLIISDEGPSIETGKDTDFVVLMSGEPQGGIAIRQHDSSGEGGGEQRSSRRRDDDDNDRSDSRRSSRSRRSGGGGGLFSLFGDD